MTSQRWQHKLLLISLSLTRRKTNNYSRTRYSQENSTTSGWGWSTPCITETKTDCTGKVREATTHWLHCPSPRPVQHHREVSPEPLIPPVEKRTWWALLPQHCRSLCSSPYTDLTPRGLQGNLWGSTTGNLTVTEKGRVLTTTSTWILADWVHTCSAQVVISTSSFAHLQNQVGSTLWWRNSAGCWLLNLNPLTRNFARPRAQFAQSQVRSWITAPPHVESVFQFHLPKMLVTPPGSCVTQSAQAKRKAGRGEGP